MPRRKDQIINGQYYHIYSRSIAKYIIFNDNSEFERMIDLFNLYRFENFGYRYSQFIQLDQVEREKIIQQVKENEKQIVFIVAYCLMPTHIHLILKQEGQEGIANFMGRVLNSYSRFFNIKHKRNGPLWSSRFKNVLIKTDEQLLHLTRYIHLNPTLINLVEKPVQWKFSSYKEYIEDLSGKSRFCQKDNLFNLKPTEYKKFVENRKKYQRQLSRMKGLLIDNYTG